MAYGLLGGLLIVVLIQLYLRPLVLEDGIVVVASQPMGQAENPIHDPGAIDSRIDPNVACWPELARLPRIGETLAKRIIEYRETHSRGTDQAGPGPIRPVFTHPEDLQQVRGIGAKTVQQIAPFLKFPGHSATSQPD